MGWKSVTWAGCLLPVLAGCGSVHNLTTGTRDAPSWSAYAYDPRNDAGAAWATVQGQHPQRAFSEEFRDGFLAGYSDYLTRGSAAQPPAVPPADYSRYKKYQTPEGEALVRDYYLGFQYGIDVAVASRRRVGSDAPVHPDGSKPPVMPAPGKPSVPEGYKLGDPKKKGSDDPPLSAPSPPKPELPVIKPFNPALPGGGKLTPLPVSSDPDLLPVPNPPLPIPAPGEPISLPSFKLDVPAPTAYVPAPPFLEQLPVIPFRYTPPAALQK